MKHPGIVAISVVLAASAAGAGEEAAIVRVIEGAARAMSELPKTRDPRSVLQFYSPDYRGITDGEVQTRAGLEAVVAEIEENVRLGNPVSIVHRTRDIRAEAAGPLGWATYDFYSRIEVFGEVLGEVERRCTGVYSKRGEVWRIRHEHCSTSWAAPESEDTEPDHAPKEPTVGPGRPGAPTPSESTILARRLGPSPRSGPQRSRNRASKRDGPAILSTPRPGLAARCQSNWKAVSASSGAPTAAASSSAVRASAGRARSSARSLRCRPMTSAAAFFPASTPG